MVNEHGENVRRRKVCGIKEGGRNLIISRRALLEEEQRASAAEIQRSITVGADLTGHVTSVFDFGAIVDLGAGVQGLLTCPRWGPACRTRTAGEKITVKVLRIDDDDAPDE